MTVKEARMLGKTWDSFRLQRRRKHSGRVSAPAWATEDTREVEQLRQTERRIAATSGWNTSTQAIRQLLRRLRGEHSGS